MNKFSVLSILAAGLLGGSLTTSGCATSSTLFGKTAGIKKIDDGRLERHDAIFDMASTVCERCKACDNIGPGKKYAAQDDCEMAQRDIFNKLWPEGDCTKRGLQEDKYIECRERVKQYQCSNNLFDLGSIVTECRQSQVCS